MFFFFRAEDVIRYGHVTGVQTCALPILRYRGYPIELLDRVAAVAQDPRVAVDVGDRGLGVRGVHETGVVGDRAGGRPPRADRDPFIPLDGGYGLQVAGVPTGRALSGGRRVIHARSVGRGRSA